MDWNSSEIDVTLYACIMLFVKNFRLSTRVVRSCEKGTWGGIVRAGARGSGVSATSSVASAQRAAAAVEARARAARGRRAARARRPARTRALTTAAHTRHPTYGGSDTPLCSRVMRLGHRINTPPAQPIRWCCHTPLHGPHGPVPTIPDIDDNYYCKWKTLWRPLKTNITSVSLISKYY